MNKYKNIKRVCIISDSFIPQKISAAGMIYNLSRKISDNGVEITCIFSGENPNLGNLEYNFNNINFITTNIVKSFRNKSLIYRFIFEIFTSISLSIKCFFYFKKEKKLDLIIWYGPSVFLWLVVLILKKINKVPVYYILRDIFPDWLINVGIVKNPILIKILKIISDPQYYVSDVIGVETYKNINIIKKKIKNNKVELLLNWPSLIKKKQNASLISLDNNLKNYIKSINTDHLFGLYIGNASIAHDYESAFLFFQGLIAKQNDVYIDLNIFGKSNNKIKNINQFIKQNIWGLIHEQKLPFVLNKADFGLVTLNRRLSSQNMPGKFVSYTQFGLPIICFSNINSSLARLIKEYDCGIVIDLNKNLIRNENILLHFINNLKENKQYYSDNSFKLFNEKFDVNKCVNKIFSNFDI